MTLKYKIENQILHCVGNLRPTIELSKNLVYLNLEFDSEWDGASVTVTFENTSLPDRIVPVLWTGEPVAVPSEVLATGELRIGCIGLADSGETRLTTARMTRGIYLHRAGSALLIAEGAESATPALWEQVLAALGTLSDLNTTDKSNLVAAVNEVLSKVGTGGSGTIDPGEIAAAVEDYLSANPPAQGEPGAPGAAATVTVGTVTTGAPGSSAAVSNSGTDTNAVFDFTIPRGNDGNSGVYVGSGDPPDNCDIQIDPEGDGIDLQTLVEDAVNTYMEANPPVDGMTPNLQIGTVETLEAGSDATASITGAPENPLLNLGIPKGPQGADYVLTEADKTEIAEQAAALVDAALLNTIGTGEII